MKNSTSVTGLIGAGYKGHATPVNPRDAGKRGEGIALPNGGKSVLSLREASHMDFVHEKRHMDVGRGEGVSACDVSR